MKKAMYMILTMVIAVLLVACSSGANDDGKNSGGARVIDFQGGAYSVNGYYELTEEKYLRAYEEYMAYHEAFVNDLSLYPVTDELINDMVSSEVALFFDGSKSAQEVAGVLQNKVQLYLSE